MHHSSSTAVLSIASIITFVAFPVLHSGAHTGSTAVSLAGILLMGVSAALPLALSIARRKK